MADEEIKDRLDQNPALAGVIEAAFQSGCRAGLEEVMVELERLLDLPDEDRDSTMDVYELKRWLDDKLKEQP